MAKNPFKEEHYWLSLVEAIRGFLASNAEGREFLESELFTNFISSPIFVDNEAPNLASGFVELSKIAAREIVRFFTEEPLATDEMAIECGKRVIAPRSGLQLLEDTLKSDTANAKALGRVLLAVKTGILTVNGQNPDIAYYLGDYFIFGGRIKFDLTDLSPAEQEQFFSFITNGQAKRRSFATHRAGGTDASGNPAEAKSGLGGAIIDLFLAMINASDHYGIDLAIGGSNILCREGVDESLGQTPDESGRWGHMYLRKDNDLVLIGIEGSGPGKHNIRTGEAHSSVGGAGERSPFLQYKIDSDALHQEQILAGKTPLSTREKYNWANVKITRAQLEEMLEADKGLQSEDYADLVRRQPDNAEKAEPNRMLKMEAWGKATKQGNQTSMAAKIVGFFLFVLGIVILTTPIPVISQVVGETMTLWGISFASGTIGISMFIYNMYPHPEKPKALYARSIAKMPVIEINEDEVGESPSSPLIEQREAAIQEFDAQHAAVDDLGKPSDALHTSEIQIGAVSTQSNSSVTGKRTSDPGVGLQREGDSHNLTAMVS